METKNQIYYLYDNINKTIINCFLALDNNIALSIIKDQINKNLKIIKISKNAQEIATIEVFLENQKNYSLHDQKNTKIIDLKDLIPKIENKNKNE